LGAVHPSVVRQRGEEEDESRRHGIWGHAMERRGEQWRLAVGRGGHAVLAVPCGRATAVPGRGQRKTGSGLWWPTTDGLWWPVGLLAPMGRP
jgi:hypothetical protein